MYMHNFAYLQMFCSDWINFLWSISMCTTTTTTTTLVYGQDKLSKPWVCDEAIYLLTGTTGPTDTLTSSSLLYVDCALHSVGTITLADHYSVLNNRMYSESTISPCLPKLERFFSRHRLMSVLTIFFCHLARSQKQGVMCISYINHRLQKLHVRISLQREL